MAQKSKVIIETDVIVNSKNAQKQADEVSRKIANIPGVKNVNVTINGGKGAKQIDQMNAALSSQRGMLRDMTGLATRYFSIFTVAQIGSSIAKTTGYFEQQQVALEGILGSASKAQSVLNEIRQFAVQSPFQTKELVTFTKQLAAFGVGNNDLFPTVKKLADISAGLGVDMSRIILAYGQVRSASVLRGQELRQFTEAGIPLVEKLAEKFTELNGRLVTTGEVFKLISERKVSFEMVASVLSDMTEEGGKFYKMQENITDTMYGQIQKLRDMWTLAMERIGKGGSSFFMGIIKMLQGAIKYGKELVVTFASAFAVSRIVSFVKALKTASLSINGWAVAIGAIVGVWTHLSEKASRVNNAMKEIDSSFNKETAKLTKGFDSLVSKIQGAVSGTKEYNEALSSLRSNYGEYLNDDMIDSLVRQKEGWVEIAESVRQAIQEVQNYNSAVARTEKSASLVKDDLEKDRTFFGLYRGMGKVTRDVLFDSKSFMEKGESGAFEYTDDFRYLLARQDAATNYMNFAFQNLMNNSGSTLGELKDEIKSLYMEDENLRRILIDHAEDYFKEVSKLESWQSYVLNLGQVENSPLNAMNKAFEETIKKANKEYEGLWENELDRAGLNRKKNGRESATYLSPSSVGAAYNPLEWDRKLQESLAKTAYEQAKNLLAGNETALKSLQERWSAISGKDTANKLIGLADALKELEDSLKNDAVLKGRLSLLNQRFRQSARIETGESLQVNQAIRGRISKSREGQYKDFYKQYMASEATYDQMVKKVIQDRADAQGFLDTHKRGTGAHAKEYDRISEEKRWLDDLFSNVYMLKDKDKKNGGAGGGWRRFFSDLFGYIKEAKAEEKKLVEFSAGTTKALEEQIKSGKLNGTAVQAFWSEGSPFQNLIKKMGEYGLETEVFNKEFLEGALSKITTKQIEATGTVDFQDVWNQLLKIISDKAQTLDKKTKDALLSYLQQMTTEGEKLFGGDKVEALIKEQLGEITRINANVEKIRSGQDMFNRIGKASNFITAQNAIYGGGQYRRYNAIDTTSNALMTLLRGKAGAGVNYAVPGLLQLLEGGNLSISNLGAIMGIREQLRNKTYADMQGSTDAERQANFENFKGVINQFDSLLKKLTEDIAAEFEQLMALRGPVTRATDDIVNALRDYKDALELIAISTQSGKISGGEADEMYIQALQKLYGATAKGMGGTGLPDYISRLYGGAGTAGVSSAGFGLGMWLGNGSLAERYANYAAAQINRSDYDSDEEYQEAVEKATKQVMDFADKMKLAGAIIQKVDGYIQAAGKFANSLINALEATNGLTTDEYGNYTYENDYSTAKEAIKTITEFSSGISSAFQSFMTGDIFGGLMNLGSAIADFFANLFGLGDSQIQKQQDKLISSNKSLDRALNNLTHEINGLAGSDKWDNLTEQMALLRSEEANYRELANLEVKKKHGDAEKAEDYRSNEDAKAKEIEDLIRGIQEEVLGTADEIAQTLTDAFVEAFKNGENAARSWRDTVRTYIGDVLKNALLEKVLAPQLDKILDSFGIKEGSTDSKTLLALLSDPARMTEMRNQLFGAGDAFTDFFNNLDPAIREMIGWNNNTTELSGGIQSITEDTARTLEGLANSMLAQLIMIQRSVMAMETSGFAQVQTSWFNDLLNQQRAIRQATDSINTILGNSRDGVRSLQVRIE